MNDYIMSRGRIELRNKLIKNFVIGVAVLSFAIFTLPSLFSYWEARDNAIRSIDYCWDYSGNHYVAPDSRCTH